MQPRSYQVGEFARCGLRHYAFAYELSESCGTRVVWNGRPLHERFTVKAISDVDPLDATS